MLEYKKTLIMCAPQKMVIINNNKLPPRGAALAWNYFASI